MYNSKSNDVVKWKKKIPGKKISFDSKFDNKDG